jgi:hypothetical protein
VRAYTIDDYWGLLVVKYQERRKLVPRRYRWWYRASETFFRQGGR